MLVEGVLDLLRLMVQPAASESLLQACYAASIQPVLALLLGSDDAGEVQVAAVLLARLVGGSSMV